MTDTVLDSLAALVEYPHQHPAEHAARVSAEMTRIAPAGAASLERFRRVTDTWSLSRLQEHYSAAIDLNPACALELGWHLFGDAHERGEFMAALLEDEKHAGLPTDRELPDHLARVLALLGREPQARAALLATLILPAIDAIAAALERAASPYAHVVKAAHAIVSDIAGLEEAAAS